MRLISKKEAAKRTTYHPVSLMRLARNNKFPQPIRIGPGPHGRLAFLEAEVEEWIQERIEQRDGATKSAEKAAQEATTP